MWQFVNDTKVAKDFCVAPTNTVVSICVGSVSLKEGSLIKWYGVSENDSSIFRTARKFPAKHHHQWQRCILHVNHTISLSPHKFGWKKKESICIVWKALLPNVVHRSTKQSFKVKKVTLISVSFQQICCSTCLQTGNRLTQERWKQRLVWRLGIIFDQ